MAGRSVQVTPIWPGAFAASCVAAGVLACLASVFLRMEPGQGLGPSDWAAVRFTIVQSIWSSLISVALALPLARALARRRFPGRGLLVTLLGAPFLLPVIVAVMGLLAIFGRNGWVNVLLEFSGLPNVSIYGFQGVVLAHVFFNLPLATRLILQGWQDIPEAQFRLAAQLRFSAWRHFQMVELPMLKRVVPGICGLIFVLCLGSFAVALLLGGGPRATTIELAIYQAFRFDFDLGRAALLCGVQMIVALGACLVLFRVLPGAEPGKSMDAGPKRWDQSWLDLPVIAMGTIFLLLPMLSIVATGWSGLFTMPDQVWSAALRSVVVALGSTVLLLSLSLPIAALAVRAGGVELAGFLGLATSPLLLGTGCFLLIFPFAAPSDYALLVTGIVNALLALPFALRILVPPLRVIVETYGRLSQSLGLQGLPLWRIVILPRLRRPLGFALGIGAALSIGDLGVIALFADTDRATLPLVIEQLLGSYRTDAAAGASLVLAALSLCAFALFDFWGRRHA